MIKIPRQDTILRGLESPVRERFLPTQALITLKRADFFEKTGARIKNQAGVAPFS